MKEMAGWRSARIASLIPNLLPSGEAAACVTRGYCWCQAGDLAACSTGILYCVTCYGRTKSTGERCDPCV
jgi:hypothetical protein